MTTNPVNSHIIPKHHLKQFVNAHGCIFTYPDPDIHVDKQCISRGGGRVIQNTAAKLGYYSPNLEHILDQRFENQGSKIAGKILDKQPITTDERGFFVKYIASYIFRVPATERTIRRLYPQILEQMKSVEYFIEQYADRVDPISYYKTLTDPAQEDERIRLCWESVIKSEHKLVHNALLSREWWIAESIGEEYFITSNNPLFYSTARGMADKNIQITFPLSQQMALVFDGFNETTTSFDIEYCSASHFIHNQVHLINKRTADNSTELYSPRRDVYVNRLLNQPNPNIQHIQRRI